jgi:hypothetical protein
MHMLIVATCAFTDCALHSPGPFQLASLTQLGLRSSLGVPTSAPLQDQPAQGLAAYDGGASACSSCDWPRLVAASEAKVAWDNCRQLEQIESLAAVLAGVYVPGHSDVVASTGIM